MFECEYVWTDQDAAACDALVRDGYLTYDAPVTVARVIEAAKASERARLSSAIDLTPPEIRSGMTDTLVWLDAGGPAGWWPR